MALQILNGPTIRAGESLSEAVDASGGVIIRITCPSPDDYPGEVNWTPAVLTFQISSDNVYYNDVYNFTGELVSVNVVPGAAIMVPEVFGRAAEFIKFRSGMPKTPIPQEKDRLFAMTIDTYGAAAP